MVAVTCKWGKRTCGGGRGKRGRVEGKNGVDVEVIIATALALSARFE